VITGTSTLTDAKARQRTHLSLKQHTVWFRASAECVSKTTLVTLVTKTAVIGDNNILPARWWLKG